MFPHQTVRPSEDRNGLFILFAPSLSPHLRALLIQFLQNLIELVDRIDLQDNGLSWRYCKSPTVRNPMRFLHWEGLVLSSWVIYDVNELLCSQLLPFPISDYSFSKPI